MGRRQVKGYILKKKELRNIDDERKNMKKKEEIE